MTVAPAFEALGDETRCRIVELLAKREHTAGELAAEFPVSRPAVSRHLRVLREAGLVQWREEAQRRVYRLEPEALDEVSQWLDGVRRGWADRLDRLEQHLDATRDTGINGGNQ
jgi:DNA-binding transcriptional ArsR family regulator